MKIAAPVKVLGVLATVCAVVEFASAAAAPPQLTVAVDAGEGAINLKPAIQWVTETDLGGGVNVEGGVSAIVEDLASISYNVWGKVKKSFGAFQFSGRADVASDAMDIVDMNVRVQDDGGSMAQVSATAGDGTVVFNSVQAKVGLNVGPGKFTLAPRYNFKSSKPDAVVGYEVDKTALSVMASGDSQKFMLSQAVSENTLVEPSITTDGDFSLAVKQKIERGTVTGTFKSDDSVSLEWADGPWVASVVAPIEGYTYNGGIRVSARKKIDF